MKKLLVVLLVLSILFNNVSALAEEILLDNASEANAVTETVAEEVTEEVAPIKEVQQEETKEETKVNEPEVSKEVIEQQEPAKEENKKEETKREVPAAVKAEAPKAEGDADAEEPKTSCNFKILYKEESVNGQTVNSGNGIPYSYQQNNISAGGSWTKTSRTLSKTKFSSGNSNYTFNGWYDEEGNAVPESMWYNANTPTRIKKSLVCSKENPEDVTVTFILKWDEEKQPIYTFDLHDYISTGSHYSDNTDGHNGTYTYTFSTPDAKTHYNLAYYKIDGDDTEYQPGDKYFLDVTGQGPNTVTNVVGYAYWNADVTVNLYSDKKLISTESSFESITVDTIPEKYGYKFLGWVDKDGNDVTELTFNPDDLGTKPTPVEVNLYAKWERIMVEINVSKVWDDDDNRDGLRKDSVTFNLMNGEEVVDTIVLNEENEWKHTFTVPKFDETSEIQYTVEEVAVDDYEGETTGDIEKGYVITNVHEIEVVDIIITKVWNDVDNQDGVRPESVTVHLIAAGEEIKAIILSEENQWTATVYDLPVNENGEPIEYIITEDPVELYETFITGSAQEGFTIENYYSPKGGEDVPEEETNPKTGDNVKTSVYALVVSTNLLVTSLYFKKKFN